MSVKFPAFLDLTGRRAVVVGGGPVAAGKISSAKINNTPTTCTAVATAKPSRSMNATPSPRTGRARASAISGSSEANKSGRYMTPTANRQTDANNMTNCTSEGEMARMLPNRMLTASPASLVDTVRKRDPSARENARVAPMTTSDAFDDE